MSDAKFIGGLLVKAPHDRAPEYVKARLSIRRAELIAWLETEQGEWINADIKVSQSGKWYAAVDDWKPEGQRQSGPPSRGGTPRQNAPRPTQRQAPAAAAGDRWQDDFADEDLPFVSGHSPW